MTDRFPNTDRSSPGSPDYVPSRSAITDGWTCDQWIKVKRRARRAAFAFGRLQAELAALAKDCADNGIEHEEGMAGILSDAIADMGLDVLIERIEEETKTYVEGRA